MAHRPLISIWWLLLAQCWWLSMIVLLVICHHWLLSTHRLQSWIIHHWLPIARRHSPCRLSLIISCGPSIAKPTPITGRQSLASSTANHPSFSDVDVQAPNGSNLWLISVSNPHLPWTVTIMVGYLNARSDCNKHHIVRDVNWRSGFDRIIAWGCLRRLLNHSRYQRASLLQSRISRSRERTLS